MKKPENELRFNWNSQKHFITLMRINHFPSPTRNEDRMERSERQTCTKMDSIEATEEQ